MNIFYEVRTEKEGKKTFIVYKTRPKLRLLMMLLIVILYYLSYTWLKPISNIILSILLLIILIYIKDYFGILKLRYKKMFFKLYKDKEFRYIGAGILPFLQYKSPVEFWLEQ